MVKLTTQNLDNLCSGAALLGSGGGGDVDIAKDYLHYLLSKNGPVDIISKAEIDKEALIIPVALMGAPLISMERVINAKMFSSLFEKVRSAFPNRKMVLMPAEIGGGNSLIPFLIASMYSLPVLDADLIGRAFPKLNMCKPAMMGSPNHATFIASPLGEVLYVDSESIDDLEKNARTITMQFGCSAAISTFIFEMKDFDNYAIDGSISRAMELGGTRDQSKFSIILGSGVVTDVFHAIENGFLNGYVKIGYKDKTYTVYFQNEYLLATNENHVIAESPAIISLIETKSRKIITSESLRFGLQVEVIQIAPPDFWLLPASLPCVNLNAFGFKINNARLAYV